MKEEYTLARYAEPQAINGKTPEMWAREALPCPFCGCTEIGCGKTNNHLDYPNWEMKFYCKECFSESFIWNSRS